MERYNVILFLVLSFWIIKYKAAQETNAKKSSSDARVIGLLVGFFSLLGFITIFVGLWCYCCHYDKQKSKEKLPVRNVSVKPMIHPDNNNPDTPKPRDEIDDGKAEEVRQANDTVPPEEYKVQTHDIPKDNNVAEED